MDKGKPQAGVSNRSHSAPDQTIHITSQTFDATHLLTAPHWSKLDVSGVVTDPNVRVLILVNPSADEPRGSALKFDQATVHVTSRRVQITCSQPPKSEEEER